MLFWNGTLMMLASGLLNCCAVSAPPESGTAATVCADAPPAAAQRASTKPQRHLMAEHHAAIGLGCARPARNLSIAALTKSGLSRDARWAVPGRTTKVLPSIASAILRTVWT